MNRVVFFLILTACLQIIISPLSAQATPPDLTDFWEGRASWVVDIYDVGLPIGESDTLAMGEGVYWSYLHASYPSAGVIDQCGMPVEFPGCLTLWQSEDGSESFALETPVCLMPCGSCPCDDQVNNERVLWQQYPRVVVADDGMWYMVYEWRAQTIIHRSEDGVVWSDYVQLTDPAGVWPRDFAACDVIEDIGEHPNIRGQGDVCLVGGPPGLYVEGDMLYVFVMAGSAPSHMRCYKGDRHGDLTDLQVCDADPLFTGAQDYGPVDEFGEDAIDYWDFRYISSADVMQVGDYYYMAYEGIRGPSELEFGRDNQFGLGFARATALDSEWETLDRNPVVMGLADNWGIGHADLLIIDGVTYMYSATSQETRGRYVLAWDE
ncbi:MAG: hypothetical protein AAFR81_10955 [Chloroflexota bacterium]